MRFSHKFHIEQSYNAGTVCDERDSAHAKLIITRMRAHLFSLSLSRTRAHMLPILINMKF